MDGLEWKSLLNWMIWGYHYFRKHPGGGFKYVLFSPRNLGKSSNLTCAYFSDGLEKKHQLVKDWNGFKEKKKVPTLNMCVFFLSDVFFPQEIEELSILGGFIYYRSYVRMISYTIIRIPIWTIHHTGIITRVLNVSHVLGGGMKFMRCLLSYRQPL